MRLTALDSRLGGRGSSVAARDDRVTALDGRVDHLFERLKDGLGTALEGSAMAGGSLPADKDFGLALNWGTFEGKHAFAGTAQARVGDSVLLHGGVGVGTDSGAFGARDGVTFA